jgi:SMC interacting uncharacterized protein involved in chromosome segregation
MLTDKDIQKIIKANIEAGKEVFTTKKDFNELRKDFNKLQSSVDRYLTKTEKWYQEMKMLGHKVDRHEKWILQIASRLGVKLDY